VGMLSLALGRAEEYHLRVRGGSVHARVADENSIREVILVDNCILYELLHQKGRKKPSTW
jgi:hypothetical protein